MYQTEIKKAMKNIHISKAVSKLNYGSFELDSYLERYNKYGEENVRKAVKDLYHVKSEPSDIKVYLAGKIIKNSRRR